MGTDSGRAEEAFWSLVEDLGLQITQMRTLAETLGQAFTVEDAGFAQFAAFDQDALDNRAFIAAQGKLSMPVLAIGGEKSFGPMMAIWFAKTARAQRPKP